MVPSLIPSLCCRCHRESDLEEVLALQTRMHNSAGVFLEANRRCRFYPGSSHSLSGTTTSHSSTTASSTCSSRPRTPNASPHGSPRRARRSPSTGTRRSTSGSNLSGDCSFIYYVMILFLLLCLRLYRSPSMGGMWIFDKYKGGN